MSGPILIVDDEPINLARLRTILDPHHELVFARGGLEALEAVAKHRPALVLLDVQMPDLDGYEVCRRLKADPATEDTPVVFVTSLGSEWHEQSGFEAGAVDYITKPVSPAVVLARVRTHLSLVRAQRLEAAYRDAVFMLGEAGHYRDTDTGAHIWRMASFTRALAEAAGLSPNDTELIELAAPLHDTGKIGIPDRILRKPGAFDDAERRIMGEHPRIGHEILKRSDAPVFQLAADVALHHHEKWDGSGYPTGLSGNAIPESARIVAIADVFDALTMERPYKAAWTVERALGHLDAGAGRHFDPRLVAVFRSIEPRILEIRAGWARVARVDPPGTAAGAATPTPPV